MGKSPSRPSTFAKPGTETSGGPGQYDAGKKFMDDVKPFTIGKRRPKKIDTDVRDYSPERAEALTKTKVPQVDLGKTGRPDNFNKPGTETSGGPGQYDSPTPFGKDVKSFKIGEKRPERIENDPRDYSPERADALTKTKVP